jgi:hypothetical protein
MADDEVAQLYVHDADGSFPVPIRQLRDSSGALSNRGIQTVSLTLNAADLAFFRYRHETLRRRSRRS